MSPTPSLKLLGVNSGREPRQAGTVANRTPGEPQPIHEIRRRWAAVKAELLAVDDARWIEFLSNVRHDFYHLPRYVELSARHERGEPTAIYVQDGDNAMLLPLVLRPIGEGRNDGTSPYGYPGPLQIGEGGQAFLREAMAAGIAALFDRGVVSMFLRFHPLLNGPPPEGLGEIVRGGDTISIDLSLGPDELWHQTRANHRIHVNRAIKAHRIAAFDEGWVHLEDFKRLYRETMARVSAMPYYFFGDEYFEDLREALADRLLLCTVDADGQVAAAGLFVETCGIVQYHLSGSDPAYAREGLTKLMIHHVRAWAKDRGDRDLHLGGGVGVAEDALFHFKAGFSPVRLPFYTLRVIVDRREYDRLVEERAPGSIEGRVPLGNGIPRNPGSFFPAYRQPVEFSSHRSGGVDDLGTRPALDIRNVGPDEAGILADLVANIDTTFFQPHPMTASEATRVARHVGRDVYLIGMLGGEAVAYGMLRGWDEGYAVPSLGIGVRRDRQRQGFGREMMVALHEVGRLVGAPQIRLRVHPENSGATALYRSLGYRDVGFERGEVLMVVDL